MKYEDIIKKVASDLGLPRDLVNKTYHAYWKAVRMHIVSLPLKEDITEDELHRLRPNINIPSIGKLFVSLDRYKRLKSHYQNNNN